MKRKSIPSRNIGLKMFGGLASVAVQEGKPWLKHECKRKHSWTQSRFNRTCIRCGREEEKNPVTGEWEHF